MSHRAAIARQTAAGLHHFAAGPAVPVMVGFDGFVDSIIQVVDKRRDADRYEPVSTIERFGRKIVSAAGKSANYELVTTQDKLGGNGPIMANAMAAAGLAVTYIGALGYPSLHPVFEPLARRAEVYSVAEPGYTDALEFDDGKLMFGKYLSVSQLDWPQIEQVIDGGRFARIVDRSRLIAMVNWTMLAKIESVWIRLIDDILPNSTLETRNSKIVFVDLADPEKRADDDLLGALRLCTRIDEQVNLVLGLNLKESIQVAKVLGQPVEGKPEEAIESSAAAIRQALKLSGVVIHPRGAAAASVRNGAHLRGPDSDRAERSLTVSYAGPFVREPKLSTGAGDNFNAGFCLGLLAGLPVDQCLCAGTAASGYYVRHAASASLEQLAEFCQTLPRPEV